MSVITLNCIKHVKVLSIKAVANWSGFVIHNLLSKCISNQIYSGLFLSIFVSLHITLFCL